MPPPFSLKSGWHRSVLWRQRFCKPHVPYKRSLKLSKGGVNKPPDRMLGLTCQDAEMGVLD